MTLRQVETTAAAGLKHAAQTRWGAALVLAVALGGLFLTHHQSASAAPAEAADRSPVTIALFTSKRTDVCYDTGDVKATRELALRERDRVNAEGGIHGRRLDLEFFDDERSTDKAVANMQRVLDRKDVIGMIGLGNSDRAKAVFDAKGPWIKTSGLPFLSAISIGKIFEEYPNVYTTRPAQDDERLPVLVQFMRQTRVQKAGFIGIQDSLFSTMLGDGLKAGEGGAALVADHRLALKEEKIELVDLLAVIEDLKQKKPDLLFLSVGGNRNPQVLTELIQAKVTPPLFIAGRVEDIPADIVSAYPADIHQAVWDRLPDVYNDRLRRVIEEHPEINWIFEGAKISGAPGWSNGECKERQEDEVRSALSDLNLRAIGLGAQAADMVGLLAKAANTAPDGADVSALRQAALQQLASTYVAGSGVYQGTFDNWSFRKDSRAVARTPFIVKRPVGRTTGQLAPLQFVRLKNDTLRAVKTLYLDMDLLRAFRIDDSEKSFFAEFNLAIHDEGDGKPIDQIEFSNAYLDPETNDRQLTVRPLNEGGKSDAYPDDMKVYQISGRFMFEPRLANYPFDTQRFSIDIRPKQGNLPFIVQPPPNRLRDQVVQSAGWHAKTQYVGYDEDFVQTVDAKGYDTAVVPFYKASFVWIMARETTDYFLRVVVPLAFILIVAYLSIFIPQDHFEAIVTIQVTALLSAVALYLSLPAILADATTLSDRIFIFNYLAISIMIGISIARISRFSGERLWVGRALGLLHVVLIPFMVLVMAVYVYQVTTAA